MLVPGKNKKLVRKTTAVFIIIFAVVFLLSFFSSGNVFAQGGDTFGIGEEVGSKIALASGDIRIIIARIVRIALGFLGVVALVIILYGGYTIMTSGGSEEKVTQGKRILINAVIGLAIIMSAFAIVQFVLVSLQKAISGGDTTGGGTARAPQIRIFAGSGALGRIVQDHYPFRDQTDVKRNTKITVTFAESIDPTSLVSDANGNGIFGDCQTADGEDFDWQSDCDLLNPEAVKIYKSDDENSIVNVATLVIPDSEGVFMFMFRPLDLLGNSNEETWYTVDLTSQILKADGETSAFSNDRDGHYFWEFQVGTLLDFDPPHITSVYPKNGTEVSRNTILQINFDEAMDPSQLQGFTDNFTNILFGSSAISGEWRITNNYKTAEFVSGEICGQNSCGDAMYCLPTSCAPEDDTCSVAEQVLIRTADLVLPGNFEAIPFTGVMDMSGNALDGNSNNLTDGKPAVGDITVISEGEEAPDNFLWQFNILNKIDKTVPFIETVLPGVDQENVTGSDPVEIRFNMPIWLKSLRSGIELQEFPANQDGVADIWFSTSADIIDLDEQSKTLLKIRHREFGPNGSALYYFPSISSDVKAVNQNCLYPGRGPYSETKNSAPTCIYIENADGSVLQNSDCVPVDLNSQTDTGCVQTSDPMGISQATVESCVSFMESVSILE
jgi:hypothetical protein